MKEFIKKDINNNKRFRLKIPTKEAKVSRIEKLYRKYNTKIKGGNNND
jgi:hypothetical protein